MHLENNDVQYNFETSKPLSNLYKLPDFSYDLNSKLITPIKDVENNTRSFVTTHMINNYTKSNEKDFNPNKYREIGNLLRENKGIVHDSELKSNIIPNSANSWLNHKNEAQESNEYNEAQKKAENQKSLTFGRRKTWKNKSNCHLLKGSSIYSDQFINNTPITKNPEPDVQSELRFVDFKMNSGFKSNSSMLCFTIISNTKNFSEL